MTRIEWFDLEVTWRTLTAMMNNYFTGGEGYSALVEARRLVEVEMREQGYETQWADLTGG
jgi:hypothetical protein